ncbi:MAG: hypothetical protein DRH37_06495 [Deltaproteobacteria bacterium]|nr:MAG: hypothetical protein DRH37_06495 [Deltaproteobacteria bacterium]
MNDVLFFPIAVPDSDLPGPSDVNPPHIQYVRTQNLQTKIVRWTGILREIVRKSQFSRIRECPKRSARLLAHIPGINFSGMRKNWKKEIFARFPGELFRVHPEMSPAMAGFGQDQGVWKK